MVKSTVIKDTDWERYVRFTSYDDDKTLIEIFEPNISSLTILLDTAELKERVQAL